MQCCPYCREPISQVQAGEDDSLDFCKMCDVIVEGQTIEISKEELEKGDI